MSPSVGLAQPLVVSDGMRLGCRGDSGWPAEGDRFFATDDQRANWDYGDRPVNVSGSCRAPFGDHYRRVFDSCSPRGISERYSGFAGGVCCQ
jgi:hypothetical protein